MICTGLYTIGEVATFTRIPARQVRRWLRGYRSGNQTYRLEQDSRRVAAIYEVPVADVETAIRYEQQLGEQRLAA